MDLKYIFLIHYFELCLVGMSCGPLRQYTYRFARNLIQLFPAMMEEKHHESLPPVHCIISPSMFCFLCYWLV